MNKYKGLLVVLVALLVVLACTVPFKDRENKMDKNISYDMIDSNGVVYAETMDKELAETADSYEVEDNEIVTCTVESLDDHSFVQIEEEGKEYVCVNVQDRTDFIIYHDLYDEIRVGDKMEIVLDNEGDLVDYEVLGVEF